MREDVKWLLMVDGEQAIAFVQRSEGHKRGLVTRIIKVCSNVSMSGKHLLILTFAQMQHYCRTECRLMYCSPTLYLS